MVGAAESYGAPIVDMLGPMETYSEYGWVLLVPKLGVAGTCEGLCRVLLGAPVSTGMETEAITESVLRFFPEGV